VVYRTTIANQSVTITVTGTATFSYKTVDDTITYSNTSAERRSRVQGERHDHHVDPADIDNKPDQLHLRRVQLTLTTDLATTELRK
jgi:hypothetical protein